MDDPLKDESPGRYGGSTESVNHCRISRATSYDKNESMRFRLSRFTQRPPMLQIDLTVV
jgi:hypothetical protein